MLGQFEYGLMDVSYFFCVFFLGKIFNASLSLLQEDTILVSFASF
jgi:hypothetical protein